jgi:hypothetical protein
MNKLVIGLVSATVCAVLLLVGFLGGSYWNRPAPTPTDPAKAEEAKAEPPVKPGDPGISRVKQPDPPPPAPPVRDEVRVRDTLKPGRTYLVKTQLAFSMRGTDHDWGIVNTTYTINYMAEAEIERYIESNDGKTIVERRTFKRVSSGKIDTKLEDMSIKLGSTGEFVLGATALINPQAFFFASMAKNGLDGRNLAPLLESIGLGKSYVDDIVQRDPTIRAVTRAGSLQGKTVKLRYNNDEEGDVQVTAEDGGSLSADEQRFLTSSVLLSDALIFPDIGVKKGESWPAKGMYFSGLIDPSLLARTEGTVTLERGPDVKPVGHPGQKQECVQINFVGGELSFRESNRKAEQVGHCQPDTRESKLIYSPQDSIFIEAFLKGRGKLTIRSKDHILFEARSDREPELTIRYTCRLKPQ